MNERKRRIMILYAAGDSTTRSGAGSKPSSKVEIVRNIAEPHEKIIASILDNVRDAYLGDKDIVFNNDSEKREWFFDLLAKRKNDWAKPRLCMYPGCTSKSIRHSHTIPSSALKLIAEEGHLFRPEFSHSRKVAGLTKIGINKASTFAGFCETHELEFKKFESVLQMNDNSDFILQMFRTACREIAIKENHMFFFRRAIEDRLMKFVQWGSEKVYKGLREQESRFGPKIEVMIDLDCVIKLDDLFTYGERKLEEWESDLSVFKKWFFQPFLDAQHSGKLVLNLTFFRHTLPERFPVALAGRGNFSAQLENGSTAQILSIINVLPVRNGTEIFMFCPSEYEQTIPVYLSRFDANEGERDALITMVESWMLHGSDHWFLSPSVWKKLSDIDQNKLTESIMNTSLNIGSKPSFNMLNEIRKNPQLILK